MVQITKTLPESEATNVYSKRTLLQGSSHCHSKGISTNQITDSGETAQLQYFTRSLKHLHTKTLRKAEVGSFHKQENWRQRIFKGQISVLHYLPQRPYAKAS